MSTGLDVFDTTIQKTNMILEEIEEQPRWRSIADKEMDYADGNQLDSELEYKKHSEKPHPL